jgi:predicted carbohydrate-binding protein with CBM5 and CBM33 domain
MSFRPSASLLCLTTLVASPVLFGHGTVVSPISRVYRVYQANPDAPNFTLAANAVAIDGTLSYYTWNELSRNIPDAVVAGLPMAFDYSPWVPDGQLASGGRVDPNSTEYPRTYAGLDQVTDAWPTTPVVAGSTIEVDFLATTPHDPSVWDVWITTPDWDPNTALNWAQMEHLRRPTPALVSGHYKFDLVIPNDRLGHHVLWVAWHRDDPVGEVFFSTSDILIEPAPPVGTPFCAAGANSVNPAGAQMLASGSVSVAANDLVLTAGPIAVPQPGLFIHGSTQTMQPFGEGFRCAAGNVTRVLPATVPDASGYLTVALDNTTNAGMGITAGATRHFQCWYRDPGGGPSGFNLTDGLSVTFVP